MLETGNANRNDFLDFGITAMSPKFRSQSPIYPPNFLRMITTSVVGRDNVASRMAIH